MLFVFIDYTCLLFPQAVVIDPTVTTKADDAYTMDNMYHAGMGVAKNLDAALKLYQTAAELGNTDAQIDLGDIYYAGEEIPQSYEKANYWYEKVAYKNNAKAQMYLGYSLS